MCNQGRQENFWTPGQKETWPPPILQIMILQLSPPRCDISKKSVHQRWIDELWFRKQLSTCLFVWTLNYNDLVHLLNSWAPGLRLGWPPLSKPMCNVCNIHHVLSITMSDKTRLSKSTMVIYAWQRRPFRIHVAFFMLRTNAHISTYIYAMQSQGLIISWWNGDYIYHKLLSIFPEHNNALLV